ncbi:hypothetical protein ACH347_24960 [Saccharopolyspora sp. 5N102]|uniref:hypothetical protein n=1 Tax=Saccharopolyspora sp. 5N102 TaxID=3375155 RepID=UPI00379AFF49
MPTIAAEFSQSETAGTSKCESSDGRSSSTGVTYTAYNPSADEVHRVLDAAEAYWRTRSESVARTGDWSVNVHLEDGGIFSPAYEVSVVHDDFAGCLRVHAGCLCTQ